jgi:hypothetical protein
MALAKRANLSWKTKKRNTLEYSVRSLLRSAAPLGTRECYWSWPEIEHFGYKSGPVIAHLGDVSPREMPVLKNQPSRRARGRSRDTRWRPAKTLVSPSRTE